MPTPEALISLPAVEARYRDSDGESLFPARILRSWLNTNRADFASRCLHRFLDETGDLSCPETLRARPLLCWLLEHEPETLRRAFLALHTRPLSETRELVVLVPPDPPGGTP